MEGVYRMCNNGSRFYGYLISATFLFVLVCTIVIVVRYQKSKGRLRHQAKEIVQLVFDDQSVHCWAPAWPVPASAHTELIGAVVNANPKAILYDMHGLPPEVRTILTQSPMAIAPAQAGGAAAPNSGADWLAGGGVLDRIATRRGPQPTCVTLVAAAMTGKPPAEISSTSIPYPTIELEFSRFNVKEFLSMNASERLSLLKGKAVVIGVDSMGCSLAYTISGQGDVSRQDIKSTAIAALLAHLEE